MYSLRGSASNLFFLGKCTEKVVKMSQNVLLVPFCQRFFGLVSLFSILEQTTQQALYIWQLMKFSSETYHAQ